MFRLSRTGPALRNLTTQTRVTNSSVPHKFKTDVKKDPEIGGLTIIVGGFLMAGSFMLGRKSGQKSAHASSPRRPPPSPTPAMVTPDLTHRRKDEKQDDARLLGHKTLII